MENRSNPINQTPIKPLAIYIDPEIISDLKDALFDFQSLKVVSASEAVMSLIKKQSRLWIQYPDGKFCDYPYYVKNVKTILGNIKEQSSTETRTNEPFVSFIKSSETIQKKIFSSVSMTPGENVKDLWDEVIKKVNAISAESHSLNSLVEKILEVPFLHHFQSSIIFLHLKGQFKAEMIGTSWRTEKVSGQLEVKDFNTFFNSVKKSKIKSFASSDFPKINLPFNASFLAKEVLSKKFSLIAVVSRHDFLNYGNDEIELFETCIDLLQPHFERLIDQEFSDKKISELRVCLKDFPLPLRVKDSQTGLSFINDLYSSELQDQDVFFNKKVSGAFSLDLYDSDELRHYAFDLFHFQRISLLGELLNTLRHELSNPLFGLKLSSQIFTTLEVAEDDKSIMREIEINVNRCQQIIENFSNLYQIQYETKPVSLKKMIDESMLLSKSETRELTKKVHFNDVSPDIELQVPLIFVVQILFNLIVNAAQAMKTQSQRGELTLEISREENFIHIEVKDNGTGIPDDKISHLFKPFFTTKSQGTGLGLVLSRNLALKMDGNLEYINHPNHKGACFRLSLPLK